MTPDEMKQAEIMALAAEVQRLKIENLRLANENAALIAQIPTGFMFPRDGEARLIE